VKSSPNCRALIQHYESCVLEAYPDPKTGGDPWTIGWGATGPGITKGVVWTQRRADERLQADIAERDEDASLAIHVPVTQGQFDAFVSILFNVGYGSKERDGIIRLRNGSPSTLLRLLNAGNHGAAREEFAKWVSPGTSVTRGLKRRRRAEQALYDGLMAKEAIEIGEAFA
jgi:lysozyme